MTKLEMDVETYGALTAALSREGADRAAILAEHGLDESDWDVIEAVWQRRLSAAMDDLEQEGVPQLVTDYSAAFSQAQQAQSSDGIVSLERFALATRQMSHTHDVQQALKQIGMTLPQFLAANQHWCVKMAADAELAERFRKILAGED